MFIGTGMPLRIVFIIRRITITEKWQRIFNEWNETERKNRNDLFVFLDLVGYRGHVPSNIV